MDSVIVELGLPRDLLAELGVSPAEATERVREWLALELFREDLISSGKAASIAGLTKGEFIDLLGRRGIPYLDLTEAELAEDVRVAIAASIGPRG